MSKNEFLVLLDTDRIMDYVFATNKLREIRGASAILDELNLNSTLEILNSFGKGNYQKNNSKWDYVPKTVKDNCIDWEVIFLGGGSGKVIFANGEKSKEFCQAIKKKYRDQTDNAASITAVSVPKLKNEEFSHWLYRGEKELRKQKDSKHSAIQLLTNPYFKVCESTGLFPAEKISEKGDRIPICRASEIKRQEAEQIRSYFAKFRTWITESEQGKDFISEWQGLIDKEPGDEKWDKILPEDLNAIGEYSNGYVGFIYADGNRMGERLSQIGSSKDYRDFSEKIKDGTQNSLFYALSKNLKMNEKQKCIPFELILLGGDDLMVLIPANKAIEIAVDFCKEFKDKTQVSISAGVLITHANYPIYRMIDHGDDLLKSAKRLSNKIHQKDNTKDENAIDFMVLKGALLQNLEEMREKELSLKAERLFLYERPYTIDGLNKLMESIKLFKKNDFPRNKLRAMYESLYRGRNQAMLDYLLMLDRLKKETKDTVIKFKLEYTLKFFPWRKDEDKNEYSTPFIDLIELYDFIDKKREVQSE